MRTPTVIRPLVTRSHPDPEHEARAGGEDDVADRRVAGAEVEGGEPGGRRRAVVTGEAAQRLALLGERLDRADVAERLGEVGGELPLLLPRTRAAPAG